jgi:hypothetical protein
VIEESKGREGNACYHPRLSLDEIERLEMETVREGFEIKSKCKPHQWVYCRHVGEVIGYSKGKATEYVYVCYAQEGSVHGLPMTLQELRNKGATI